MRHLLLYRQPEADLMGEIGETVPVFSPCQSASSEFCCSLADAVSAWTLSSTRLAAILGCHLIHCRLAW
jgi:hypothetical protein